MRLPLLGRTLEYVQDPQALFERQWAEHGPVSELPLLGNPWVLLLGPDACGAALTNGDKAFANGPAWTYLVGPFFRRGLMLLDFDEHRLHRRALQQAFTRDRLEGYARTLQPAALSGVTSWRPDPAFRAQPALKELTLDLAAQIFMGGAERTSPEEMRRVNRAFIDCVQAATALVRHPLPGTRWGRATRGRVMLEGFLRDYLPARRADPGEDLLSQLCLLEDDDGRRLDDQAVVDHMVFLMMAAHDTSTSTLTTMVEMLGKHPEWQERCRAESLALGPAPSLSELESLTSLDLVMRESLRLRPPVPILARRTVRDTEVLGTPVPAGRYVAVAPGFSHRMPEHWSEPGRFYPERFGPERREDRSHRHAWMPFGAGVHKCLGMAFAGIEVTTVMHQLLRHCSWSVDPAYRPPLDHRSLPFPTDGQPIDLRLRETP